MDLNKMRCENCIFYRSVYIHPWSKGIDRDKIGAYNAYACIAECSIEAQDNFKDSSENYKPSIMVTIGETSSIGCELFTERKDGPNSRTTCVIC